MAILAYSSSGVRTVAATSSQITVGTLGESGNKGQPVRLSTSDNKYYLVDANSVDPAGAEFDGYLLDNGAADEQVAIQTGGTIYLGVNTVPGMLYCASATVGQTEEATSALVTGNHATMFGYGDELFNLIINKLETGISIPS